MRFRPSALQALATFSLLVATLCFAFFFFRLSFLLLVVVVPGLADCTGILPAIEAEERTDRIVMFPSFLTVGVSSFNLTGSNPERNALSIANSYRIIGVDTVKVRLIGANKM